MSEYDASDDSVKSYYAAIEAKRERGDAAIRKEVVIGDCRLLLGDKSENGPIAPVKVGLSANPIARLSSIQTGNPQRLELVHVFLLPTRELAVLAEQECHSVLNQFTMKGEWFECDPMWALRILGAVVRWALEEEFEDEEEFQKHLQMSSYESSREKISETPQ